MFSGEDCTSTFKGKVALLKKLQKNPKYQKVFSQCGDDWTMKSEVKADEEAFTWLSVRLRKPQWMQCEARCSEIWWKKMKSISPSPS